MRHKAHLGLLVLRQLQQLAPAWAAEVRQEEGRVADHGSFLLSAVQAGLPTHCSDGRGVEEILRDAVPQGAAIVRAGTEQHVALAKRVLHHRADREDLAVLINIRGHLELNAGVDVEAGVADAAGQLLVEQHADAVLLAGCVLDVPLDDLLRRLDERAGLEQALGPLVALALVLVRGDGAEQAEANKLGRMKLLGPLARLCRQVGVCVGVDGLLHFRDDLLLRVDANGLGPRDGSFGELAHVDQHGTRHCRIGEAKLVRGPNPRREEPVLVEHLVELVERQLIVVRQLIVHELEGRGLVEMAANDRERHFRDRVAHSLHKVVDRYALPGPGRVDEHAGVLRLVRVEFGLLGAPRREVQAVVEASALVLAAHVIAQVGAANGVAALKAGTFRFEAEAVVHDHGALCATVHEIPQAGHRSVRGHLDPHEVLVPRHIGQWRV